jgi:excisionase family DNA binding protein
MEVFCLAALVSCGIDTLSGSTFRNIGAGGGRGVAFRTTPRYTGYMAMINTAVLAIQPNVYYTIEEAAELLRVSPHAIKELLRSGRAQGVKVGRQWRILGAALLDLSAREEQSEAALVSDWLAASSASLAEVWDNEEDAVYDEL